MEDPQSPEELARIHEQLWQTVLQFGNFSASQERNRIARDLHDSLGQALTALNIQLQTAVKLWQLDPARAEQFLEEAQRLGSTAVQEVRQTVRTLRTDCPDDQSIETLITSLVESFHRSTGVLPTVKLTLVAPLPPEVVTPVYRIIQEGLNNICKYAQATEVNLQLSTTPTSLGLILEDNGRGFDLEQTVTGFGLRGMQERVSLLRGRFQVETQLGAGCRIRIVMPLRVLSLQDTQGLVPPPPTSDEPPAPPPALAVPPLPPPAPNIPDRAESEVQGAESLPDDPDLTRMTERDLETVPSLVLPLMGEEDAISNSLAPDLTALPPSESPDAMATPIPETSPSPGVILTSAQTEHLTQMLLQGVGPIASILLHQAIAQAQQPLDLITYLTGHLPPQHREHFEQQAQDVLNQAPSIPQLDLLVSAPVSPALAALPMPHSPGEHSLGLSTELTCYCEQELTALIGPVAHFLIQEALATSPSMPLEELLDCLAANIPNPQIATQFKQRILSYAS